MSFLEPLISQTPYQPNIFPLIQVALDSLTFLVALVTAIFIFTNLRAYLQELGDKHLPILELVKVEMSRLYKDGYLEGGTDMASFEFYNHGYPYVVVEKVDVLGQCFCVCLENIRDPKDTRRITVGFANKLQDGENQIVRVFYRDVHHRLFSQDFEFTYQEQSVFSDGTVAPQESLVKPLGPLKRHKS